MKYHDVSDAMADHPEKMMNMKNHEKLGELVGKISPLSRKLRTGRPCFRSASTL